jgi:hypothetical protein
MTTKAAATLGQEDKGDKAVIAVLIILIKTMDPHVCAETDEKVNILCVAALSCTHESIDVENLKLK